jgi:hypothetical protein
MNKKKLQAMLASYARSFLGASLAVFATGETGWRVLLVAGLSAVVPVAIRAINPKDPAFGMVADIAKVEIDKLAKANIKKSK